MQVELLHGVGERERDRLRGEIAEDNNRGVLRCGGGGPGDPDESVLCVEVEERLAAGAQGYIRVVQRGELRVEDGERVIGRRRRRGFLDRALRRHIRNKGQVDAGRRLRRDGRRRGLGCIIYGFGWREGCGQDERLCGVGQRGGVGGEGDGGEDLRQWG